VVVSGPGLETALQDLLAQTLGDPALRVTPLQRLSGGASRQTWSFDAVRADGAAVPCILRRDPPGVSRPGAMVREAAVLRAAEAAGVPVPRVIADGDGAEPLGAPFIVMERVEGETIPRRILRDDVFAEARPHLVAQCATAAARIHAIPTDATPALGVEDPLRSYRDIHDAQDEPHPTFELAFRWLRANRPPVGRTRVVHGDFRLGNFIIGPDGLRAVIDWELVHLGDPVEDLGWLCVRAWRYGGSRTVGGFGDVDELLAAYVQAGGEQVDPETLRWWEVMGTLRWGIICILQAATHLSGAVRSVELAAIGRRVCEVEWDLLLLLEKELAG